MKWSNTPIVLMCLFFSFALSAPVKAAFPIASDSTIVQRIETSAPVIAKALRAKTEARAESGFFAYVSIGCGLLGVLIGSLHTTAILLLLGLIAGIAGKMGLSRYKRKWFRALCILGIILGGVCVLFATVPILFLT